jgi:hypothetical protein
VCTASAGKRGGEKGGARRRCNFSFLKSFCRGFLQKAGKSKAKKLKNRRKETPSNSQFQ